MKNAVIYTISVKIEIKTAYKKQSLRVFDIKNKLR